MAVTLPKRANWPKREDWAEQAALSASMLCLIHCLALPLLLAALPAISTILHIPESFHVWMLFLVAPASGAALIFGWARHGIVWPLILGGCGLTALAAGALLALGTPAETPLTVLGSLVIAGAHLANWRLRHACSHDHSA